MVCSALLFCLSSTLPAKIDRHALVQRHDVVLTSFDGQNPLQVGNGEFAMGLDITGLQSFAPFNTMSQWGWHSSPIPAGTSPSDFQGQVWDTHGRPVRYPMPDPEHPAISYWFESSPHRINLGRVGFAIRLKDGALAEVEDLKNPRQTLDLWNGVVISRFDVEGQPVVVKTACHPTMDAGAVYVESPLLQQGRLAIFAACPGNNPLQFANFVGDWSHPGKFDLVQQGANHAEFSRNLDEDDYRFALSWEGQAKLEPPHAEDSDLKIVSARFGADQRWADVTEALQNQIHDGRIRAKVVNAIFGDPALGARKVLEVVYSSHGHERKVRVEEGQDVVIDPAPERERLTLQPAPCKSFSATFGFSKQGFGKALPQAKQVLAESRKAWPNYWQRGGAIDLSGSTDSRWKELERRIVLSQYLMKVNEAGSLPPQESGLVNNGWYGRFHMEMVWWHAAHWALWNKWPELDKNLSIYKKLLASSKKLAKSEGYKGARWPKCLGSTLTEWPHVIHSLLIWQQPHPIFFADLDYRAHPTQATLEKWWPVVEATADFLASYAFYDSTKKMYILGPPVHVVSENTDPKTTQNPTFELGYWRYGLRVAEAWRAKLGKPAKKHWGEVLQGLSPLPQQDGVYVLHEGVQNMWTQWNFEHPALTGIYGMLPGDGVDKAVMVRTLDKVTKVWNFDRTWGWDFPMLAMCAARLGEPSRAIDFLLHPAAGFQFDQRGLATGGPFPYFPSNGGLLYAVAMMAKGWDGAPSGNAPGFPKGTWNVRSEGLGSAP